MLLKSTRLGLVGTLGGLYAMIIVVLGVAHPIAFYLSSGIQDEGLYLPAFHIYLYTVSMAFLLYVQFSMVYMKRKYARRMRVLFNKGCTMTVNETDSTPSSSPRSPLHSGGDAKALQPYNDKKFEAPEQDDVFLEHPEIYDIPFTLSAEGVNFYLRLGTIGFALGTMAQDSFYIIQFFNGSAKVWNCFGVPYIVMMCERIVFTLFQAFFIFKHHRVILKFNTSVIRVGLLHTIATNLCIWAMVVVHEATEAIVHMDDHIYHTDNLTTTAVPSSDHHFHTINVSDHSHGHHKRVSRTIHAVHGGEETHASRITTLDCLSEQTISNSTAPYLYPFIIEFSLCAAAVLYKIFTNVGGHVETLEEEEERKHHVSRIFEVDLDKHQGECGKANTGLFLGMFMFMLTLVATCMFMIFYTNPMSHAAHVTGWIYFVTDASVNFISVIVTILAFVKIRKLCYVKITSHFDENLVIISLTGVYFLMAFAVIPSFAQLGKPGYTGQFALFQVCSKTVKFLQTTLQVVFIIDSLRRRAATREQLVQKPGRSLITFLLIANLAMWVINTFQMKEITSAEGVREYYGSLAWVVMVHMTQPLAIFFRFHSSICLSDIWTNSYKPHLDSIDKLLNEEEKPIKETQI